MRFSPILLLLLILGAGCSSAPKEDTPAAQDPATPPPAAQAAQVRQPKENVFEIDRSDGCTIRWALAVDSKSDEVQIDVKDACRFSGGLARSLPLYGELLDAVLAKHSKSRLKRFSSTSWKAAANWDQDLAVAAIESGLWKTFTEKRKTKKRLSPNLVFVGVFNEGRIHRKLAEVFETRGLT